MSVIELDKDDIDDLKDGYIVRLKIDSEKYALIGPNFFDLKGIAISENDFKKLTSGKMVHLERDGKHISIIGPKFEL